MTILPRRPRGRGRRAPALLTAGLLILGVLGFGALDATTASADAAAHTLVNYTPESFGPYQSQPSAFLNAGVDVTISCYVTGDVITGPYGPENVWDELAGGAGVMAGSFVPDADIYTGSNSPVVPRCATVLAQVIGGGEAYFHGPGTYDPAVYGVPSGEYIEITCYSTGPRVTGPYGSETIWDRVTSTYETPREWIPDALAYTGSNSAVVPPC